MIKKISQEEILDLIYSPICDRLGQSELAALDEFARRSRHFWYAKIRGEVVAIWGLYVPTLMSNEAVIWVQTFETIKTRELAFMRQSRAAAKEALAIYPRIYGFTDMCRDSSVRWLKWIGAKFDPPTDRFARFVMEA